MKPMSKSQLLKLTRCTFFVHVADYNFLVRVTKKELRAAFKKAANINYSVDLSQINSTIHEGRIYSTAIILM